MPQSLVDRSRAMDSVKVIHEESEEEEKNSEDDEEKQGWELKEGNNKKSTPATTPVDEGIDGMHGKTCALHNTSAHPNQTEVVIENPIDRIRATSRFKVHKLIISGIATVLTIFYIFGIWYIVEYDKIQENKRYIALIVVLIALILVQLTAIFAVITEHLILILIYDIITKITLITLNPLVCIQCILLNNLIKDLDKIHKLKHKK